MTPSATAAPTATSGFFATYRPMSFAWSTVKRPTSSRSTSSPLPRREAHREVADTERDTDRDQRPLADRLAQHVEHLAAALDDDVLGGSGGVDHDLATGVDEVARGVRDVVAQIASDISVLHLDLLFCHLIEQRPCRSTPR